MKRSKSAQISLISPDFIVAGELPRAGIEPAWYCYRGILSALCSKINHGVTTSPDKNLTKTIQGVHPKKKPTSLPKTPAFFVPGQDRALRPFEYPNV